MSFESNHTVVGDVALETIVRRRKPVWGRLELSPLERDANYARGVNYAGEMEYIAIAVNNVWGGRAKDGGSVTSYEAIGYHAGADRMILGAIESGCAVFAYCDDGWRRVTL